MKTILLNFEHRPMEEPMRARVVAETAEALSVRFSTYSRVLDSLETLTKQADGSFRNQHGCGYIRVKADRRPKPFRVTYRGMDGAAERKFATLAELQTYVRERWEGVDYIDGTAAFHNDYGSFTLRGCALADLGTREGWHWTWKAL